MDGSDGIPFGADAHEGDDDVELPGAPLLHPDDRLWRHPSEVGLLVRAGAPTTGTRPAAWTGLLGGAIGAMLVAGFLALGGGFRTTTVIEKVAVPLPAGTRDLASTDIPAIAARVRPSIVQLEVHKAGDVAIASGVVFRSDGHIMTNHHVVANGGTLKIICADGHEYAGRVIGGDTESDVAVVRIEDDHDPMPVATLGSISELQVGEVAIAIGSPLGLAGGPSVSVGVVSAMARQVEGDDGHPLLDMIQTDAPIAPGSSGGALLDRRGSVIGITTAIAVDESTGAEGLGFATPIDIAHHVAEQLINTGRVTHVWLGIDGDDLDAVTAKKMGVEEGAVIKRVRDGSPAEKAGLRAGDVIMRIDERAITSMASLVVSLRTRSPGDKVHLVVLHKGQRAELDAVLAERPGYAREVTGCTPVEIALKHQGQTLIGAAGSSDLVPRVPTGA